MIWINFDPRTGREQGGHRPAVVLSPIAYNRLVGLLVCVPLTTRIKGYPFEVPIERESVALTDHVRSLDWRARKARSKGRVTPEELEAIRVRVHELLG